MGERGEGEKREIVYRLTVKGEFLSRGKQNVVNSWSGMRG